MELIHVDSLRPFFLHVNMTKDIEDLATLNGEPITGIS
jgi:hypothetical protein